MVSWQKQGIKAAGRESRAGEMRAGAVLRVEVGTSAVGNGFTRTQRMLRGHSFGNPSPCGRARTPPPHTHTVFTVTNEC